MGRSIAVLVSLCLTMVVGAAGAQELEPRAYSNAPVGLQFVVLGYSYATGGLVFDPGVPIEDASADVSIGVLAYVRTLGFLGKTARITVALPGADGKATGLVSGEPAERVLSGLGDARLGFGWLFYGAPANLDENWHGLRPVWRGVAVGDSTEEVIPFKERH